MRCLWMEGGYEVYWMEVPNWLLKMELFDGNRMMRACGAVVATFPSPIVRNFREKT